MASFLLTGMGIIFVLGCVIVSVFVCLSVLSQGGELSLLSLYLFVCVCVCVCVYLPLSFYKSLYLYLQRIMINLASFLLTGMGIILTARPFLVSSSSSSCYITRYSSWDFSLFLQHQSVTIKKGSTKHFSVVQMDQVNIRIQWD